MELEGEIVGRARDGWWIVVAGEALVEFQRPILKQLRVGHRVVLHGDYYPRKRSAFDNVRFDTEWVDVGENSLEERERWLREKAPFARAPLPSTTSPVTVIGTVNAVADARRAFVDFGLAEPNSIEVPAKAEDIRAALVAEAARKPAVIVLVRGGGVGVHIYNDLKLAETIADVQRRIPVVVGVGHAPNATLSCAVAVSRATPSLAACHVARAFMTDEATLAALATKHPAARTWQAVAVATFFVGAAIGAAFGAAML